jgi:hypothetical protein
MISFNNILKVLVIFSLLLILCKYNAFRFLISEESPIPNDRGLNTSQRNCSKNAESNNKNERFSIIGIRFSESIKFNNKNGKSSINGRYLFSNDNCYEFMIRNTSKERIIYFETEAEALKAGFTRKPYGIVELKKYCGVCSVFYEHLLLDKCEIIFFDNETMAIKEGYIPIERFDVYYPGNVVGFGYNVYAIPCTPMYECIMALKNDRYSPLCCIKNMDKDKIIIFESEKEAREKGYISELQLSYNECFVEF